MRGKRYESKPKKVKKNANSKRKNSLFINLLLLIFIAMMIVSGTKIYKWIKENIASRNIKNDINNTVTIDNSKDTVEKYNVDFASLKEQNQDTIAWIKVNGTGIEYPVVKTKDNDFYMTHSFDKTYNSAGWVFMDYKNKFNGKDNNMIIYGHNRRDGSMFGTLKNILNEEWQNNEENLIIPFITENEKAEFQVFSVYRIEKEDYYVTTNFGSMEEFKKYIDTVKKRSLKDFNIEVTEEDNLLTLSTCADNNSYRVVLHAVKKK